MKTDNNSRSQKGFTLAETLLAVLILLMVSSIVATGVPVAKNAYEKIVISANAEVLLSTTISALRSELGTATDVEINRSGDIIQYYSSKIMGKSRIYLETVSGMEIIKIWQYVLDRFSIDDPPDKDNSVNTRSLVSDKTSTSDLYVSYDLIEVKNGYVVFNGLAVYKRNDLNKNNPLTEKIDQNIRFVSAKV